METLAFAGDQLNVSPGTISAYGKRSAGLDTHDNTQTSPWVFDRVAQQACPIFLRDVCRGDVFIGASRISGHGHRVGFHPVRQPLGIGTDVRVPHTLAAEEFPQAIGVTEPPSRAPEQEAIEP